VTRAAKWSRHPGADGARGDDDRERIFVAMHRPQREARQRAVRPDSSAAEAGMVLIVIVAAIAAGGAAIGGLVGARVAGGLVGGMAGAIAGFAAIYLRYRDL
jgi:hypothetical protein